MNNKISGIFSLIFSIENNIWKKSNNSMNLFLKTFKATFANSILLSEFFSKENLTQFRAKFSSGVPSKILNLFYSTMAFMYK